MRRSFPILALLLSIALPILPAAAQRNGMVTVLSAHSVDATIERFTAAVQDANWVVFTRIDHAAAAQAVGMTLRPRIVILFGNPRAGTPAMAATPTLALDLPMRVLVWQDDAGRTQVTRSTGEDLAERLFARHGIVVPPTAQRNTDAFIEGLVRQAAE